MEDFNVLIVKLEERIRTLIKLHSNSREESRALQERVEELESLLNEKVLTINQLEEQIEILKITGSLEKGKENTDVKRRIDELIREIDRCTGMINN